MKTYKIGLACDHAGYELKEFAAGFLLAAGHSIQDCGCYSAESVDYPDFAHKLGAKIDEGSVDFGVAICGSANGITMAVNKHAKVRAAICWKNEIAQLARAHNDANVCSLPARFLTQIEAAEILDTFFTTEFEGGRHAARVAKI